MLKTKEYLDNLWQKLDLLAPRERIIIAITSWVVVYFLWQILVFDSIYKLKHKLTGNTSKVQEQISNLQGQINQVANALSLDPVVRIAEQIKRAKQETLELDQKLASLTEKLIPPKDMMVLLQNILANHKLTVLNLKNIPPTPVLTTGINEQKVDPELKFQVYKHGIEFTLAGSFFELRDFLIAIEALPWKLFWKELEFTTNTYPMATIKLVVNTLSINTSLLSIY